MTPAALKAARAQLNLTQAELAPLLGMPQNALARLESGERQPTKIHTAALQALLFIHRHSLLPQFITEHQTTAKK